MTLELAAYVAGSIHRREEFQRLVERETDWLLCTARWLTDPDWHKGPPSHQHYVDMATGDLEDVDRSDALIAFPEKRGWGHPLEIGYALARRIPVVCVVPADVELYAVSVFLHHPWVKVVPTWEAACEWVRAFAARDPERAGREGDTQALPDRRPGVVDIQTEVIRDIEKRRLTGIERYGTALKPHNGRDALVDAYEEALDLAMYLRQRIEEEKDADEREMRELRAPDGGAGRGGDGPEA